MSIKMAPEVAVWLVNPPSVGSSVVLGYDAADERPAMIWVRHDGSAPETVPIKECVGVVPELGLNCIRAVQDGDAVVVGVYTLVHISTTKAILFMTNYYDGAKWDVEPSDALKPAIRAAMESARLAGELSKGIADSYD